MNWHKRLLFKTAAAASKIKRYNIASPSVKFFIHKYENIIPWNDVEKAKTSNQSPEEVINNFISTKLLPSLLSKIEPASKDNNYMKRYDVKAEYEAAMAVHRQNPDQPVPADLEVAYREIQKVLKRNF